MVIIIQELQKAIPERDRGEDERECRHKPHEFRENVLLPSEPKGDGNGNQGMQRETPEKRVTGEPQGAGEGLPEVGGEEDRKPLRHGSPPPSGIRRTPTPTGCPRSRRSFP